MLMNENMIGEQFLIEKVNGSEEVKKVLETIGIMEGVTINILGKGHLEGSMMVNVNNIYFQLNPYFVKILEGSLVNELKRSK